ncbi:MAG: hypothetical protein ABII68_09410 [Pseudomonadota bacterium]
MKQKYETLKDDENNKLVIREYAELDKEILSFVCEQTYDLKDIRAAAKKGKRALISALRTQNVYPAARYAEKLADSVTDLLKSKDNQPRELFFDDLDLLPPGRKPVKIKEDTENEAVEVDELLDEDESVPDYVEKDVIDKFTNSISIADDEPVDLDEET